MTKILLVVVHPRSKSLTHDAAEAFATAARANGHTIEWANLYEEHFDPVLREHDEPDWSDAAKVYSPAVVREMARIERNEATVLVFPVWWWSMPAMLKGWIDRVWNNGWAYGGRNYPHARVSMIAIGGSLQPDYAKRGYDAAMRTTLQTGILEYCGVADPCLHFLHGAIEGGEHPVNIITEAQRLGRDF